jgi:hypothetical protein
MYSVFGALWLWCFAAAGSAAEIVAPISASHATIPIDKRIALSRQMIRDFTARRRSKRAGYGLIAALTSFTPSSLTHSAGPAMAPISQPAGSTMTVVGMPKALPASLRSSKIFALSSA